MHRHCLHIRRQVKSEKWLMPRIRPGCRVDLGAGRVLFAGEAAGFLNPMGEGISAGMESGYYAVLAVMEHFDSPSMVFKAYRQRHSRLPIEMRQHFVGRNGKLFTVKRKARECERYENRMGSAYPLRHQRHRYHFIVF